MVFLRRRRLLGEWLFQYCFARVLARRFGYRLAALPVAGFPGTLAEMPGEEVYGPVGCWQGQWPFEAWSGRRLERAELGQAPGQRLTLDGGFQRFEFIAEAREEIRGDWLRMDGAEAMRPSGDFAIALEAGGSMDDGKAERKPRAMGAGGKGKRDDGKEADGLLTEEGIRRLVGTVGHERLYFVTDRPGHPLLGRLRDLRGEVIEADGLAGLRCLRSFPKVALGQSALHWWAAFLGEAREIYFPRCDRGPWSHPEPAHLAHEPGHYGIDLRVRDEARYIYDW